ncbi:MAG: D-alanyl-D-alanine carboxypeptidase [Xanthobacteraceae bacterium]
MVGFLVGVAAVAFAVDSADAKSRRRSKKTSSYNPPYSAIVVDANSGKVLHASEADGIRHPASLTKIMTLYLLFERMEAGKVSTDTLLNVSAHAASQSPTKLGLKAGSTIKVEDAILGLVTKSANDAAVVIAEALAGDEEDFAKLMTRKARALGMSHTVYKNASGLPDSDQVTTARDQALLGRAIQDRFPKYYRYFSTKSFTFRGTRMGNHNHLLGSVPGVDGIKTGYVNASGFNLVASMKRNNRHLVAVVLGGSSGSARDARMRSLLEKYVVEAAASRTAPMIAESGDGGEIAPVSVAATAADPSAPAPAKPISSSRTELKAGHAAKKVAAAAVDPIKPNSVRTIKVKLNGVHSASLTPRLAHLPVVAVRSDTAAAQRLIKSTQTIAIEETPDSQPAAPEAPAAAEPAKSAVRSAAPAPAAEPREAVAAPIQVASAEPSIAIAAAAPAEAPKKAVRTGWMIQVGAFEAERDAKDRLSSAQSKAKNLLANADPFTETVVKDNQTFYRARFAGFAKSEAEAACKYLRRNDFACFALKN